VQKNDRRPIGGASLGVTDIQGAGIDLLERGERGIRSRLDAGQLGLGRLRLRESGHAELSGGDGDGRGPKEPAAIMIDCVRRFDLAHGTAPVVESMDCSIRT
jgi:hypothetical protein